MTTKRQRPPAEPSITETPRSAPMRALGAIGDAMQRAANSEMPLTPAIPMRLPGMLGRLLNPTVGDALSLLGVGRAGGLLADASYGTPPIQLAEGRQGMLGRIAGMRVDPRVLDLAGVLSAAGAVRNAVAPRVAEAITPALERAATAITPGLDATAGSQVVRSGSRGLLTSEDVAAVRAGRMTDRLYERATQFARQGRLPPSKEAQDLATDALGDLIRSGATVVDENHLANMLRQQVERTRIDYLRHADVFVQPSGPVPAQAANPGSHARDALTAHREGEVHDLIFGVDSPLTSAEREAFQARYVRGLSFEEMAKELNVSLSTAKRLYDSALAKVTERSRSSFYAGEVPEDAPALNRAEGTYRTPARGSSGDFDQDWDL